MNLSSFMGAGWLHGPQVLHDDEGILLCRACHEGVNGERKIVLAVVPAAEHPTPQSLDRLAHEFGLRDELDSAWAAKPLELLQDRSRTILVLEDLGGEPLTWLMDAPMETGSFLRLAIQMVAAVGKVHQRGLMHKDIKPANFLVNRTNGGVRLTGFGFASRRPRERQPPDPARVDRRHSHLHGARADRSHEPLDRLPKRSVFTGYHSLPDAHRLASIHGVRSDGMGALPYRQKARSAKRAAGEYPGGRFSGSS